MVLHDVNLASVRIGRPYLGQEPGQSFFPNLVLLEVQGPTGISVQRCHNARWGVGPGGLKRLRLALAPRMIGWRFTGLPIIGQLIQE